MVAQKGEERGGREAEREHLKSISKCTRGEGGLKLINLERKHFLAPIQK